MSEKGCQRSYNLEDLMIHGTVTTENISVNGRIVGEGGIEYLGGTDMTLPDSIAVHNSQSSQYSQGNFRTQKGTLSIEAAPKRLERELVANTINVIDVMNYFLEPVSTTASEERPGQINLKLPKANRNTSLFLIQVAPVLPRALTENSTDMTMHIKCDDDDNFMEGSLIESRAPTGGAAPGTVIFNSCTGSNNKRLIYTLESCSTNSLHSPLSSYFTIGSRLLFTCVNEGEWKISYLFTGRPGPSHFDSITVNYGGTFQFGAA